MGQVASRLVIFMGIAALLVAACSEGSADQGHRLAAGEACPVTIPPQPGFEPPPPWPSQAPPLYSAVWYGDEDLWYMLDPDGERWASDRHGVKLFWFSSAFAPNPEATPQLALRAVQLDGNEIVEVPGPSNWGQRAANELHFFMIGGISLPEGCWELTATYRGAELSFVLLRDDTLAP